MSRFQEAVAAMPDGAREQFEANFARHTPGMRRFIERFPPLTTLRWEGRTFWVLGYVEKRGCHHELILSPMDPFEDAMLANTFSAAVCPECHILPAEAN